MSTILKALRRLEQERSKGAERPLKEEVVYARPRALRPWGNWGLIGGALVLGFAATWAVLPPSSSDGGDAAPTAAAAMAAPSTNALLVPPPLPPPVAARGAAAGAMAAEPASAPPPAPAPAPNIESRSATRAVPAAPASESPRSTPAIEIDAARDPAVVVAPIEGRASRLVDEEPAPRRAHAEVPVHVVRTTWHPRAERRAAWVAIGGADPREVREGEWVGALEIRTIEPDGILFADGPILVHRRIGER